MMFSFINMSTEQLYIYMLFHTEQVIQFFESSNLVFNGHQHYLFIDQYVGNYSFNIFIVIQFTLQTAWMS